MELRRQIVIARRWLPLLVAGPLLAGGAAYLWASQQPPVYQASARLLPEQLLPGSSNYGTTALSRLVVLTTNYAFLARSPELLSDISSQVAGGASTEDLDKRVGTVVDLETAGLTITAAAGDRSTAAALANAVSRAVEARSSESSGNEELLADLDTTRDRMLAAEADYQRLLALPVPRTTADELALANALGLLRELTTVYNTLNASLSNQPGGMTLVDQATPQRAVQTAPLTLYYTLLAAIAGFLIAAAIAAVIEYLDDRVRDPEAAREVSGSGELGTIPQLKAGEGPSGVKRLVALTNPRSAGAEAYGRVRANIEFASTDLPLKALLVTSPLPRDGKSITAANLAVAYAQAGRRVLLVDADLRKPGLHHLFDLPNTRGLTTLLGSVSATVDAVAQPTENADLRVITSGPLPPKPAELLGSQRMLSVLEGLKAAGDLVVLDSPPLLVVSDSAILSSFADGTVLVIDARKSRERDVRQGRDTLEKAGARVLGFVLNRAPGGVSGDRVYYGGPEETRGILERLRQEAGKPTTH